MSDLKPKPVAKSKKSLSRSALTVANCTLISRLFGFARDMLVAQFFGAGIGVDAFLVANKIPNFMRRLFAEGAFSQAFVPVLSEYRKTRPEPEVKLFIDHITGILASVLFVITILGVLASPVMILIFAPGFEREGERFILASQMLKITFPYLLFISLTALAGAILNSYDKFGVPAFTPVLLNLSIILCAVFIAPHMPTPIVSLAIGVFIGGLIQLIFQFPFLKQIHRFPLPKPSFKDPGVRRVMKLMVPALFGVSIAQINILIDQWFASFLQIGSISWLYYSDRITQLPLGVFGIAIATVILPSLSRQNAVQDKQQYSKTLDWGLRKVLVVGLPASLGLVLLAGPILATLFNYGEFNQRDVLMASYSLVAFSVGLPAFMLVKVLASGFYAKQNIKLPVKIGVVSLVANTLLVLCFIWSLKHAGLALATSLAAFLNAGLLFILLRKKEGLVLQPGWGKYWLQVILGLLAISVFTYFATPGLSQWFEHGWPWKALHLSISIIGAILSYFLVLYFAGYRWRGR